MHRLAHSLIIHIAVASLQLGIATAQEATYSAGQASVVGPSSSALPTPVAPVVDPKANFRETGRFGLIGALTEDMWKGGFVFEHEHWEAQLLAHAGFYSRGNRDVHIIYKMGGRVALGTLNYLAFGGEIQGHPGSMQDHHKDNKSWQVGPYVSLQRYFAATPVMLNLWVNPVQYDRFYTFDSGSAKALHAIHVFQTGGFGIAYLF